VVASVKMIFFIPSMGLIVPCARRKWRPRPEQWCRWGAPGRISYTKQI